MVSKKIKRERVYFVCDKCGLFYIAREKAEQCEIWCKNNPGSCNPKIVKFAVKID